MNEIYNYIKNWGSNINVIYNLDGSISHLYWIFENKCFCVVEPHRGNDYTYLLRINRQETFDRWSNAEVEMFTKTAEEIILYLIEYI